MKKIIITVAIVIIAASAIFYLLLSLKVISVSFLLNYLLTGESTGKYLAGPACEKNFLEIYEKSKNEKDASICRSENFDKRGYYSIKGDYACLNENNNKYITPSACYTEFTGITQNISLCAMVDRNIEKCFDEIQGLVNNLNWCEKLENRTKTFYSECDSDCPDKESEVYVINICNACNCYKYIARKTNNIEVCHNISEKNKKDLDECLSLFEDK